MAFNDDDETTKSKDLKTSDGFEPVVLHDLQSPEVCVICLDRLSEKTVIIPCRHDQFDFSCLGTWLQDHRACPLCKQEVTALEYGLDRSDRKVFYLPLPGLHLSPAKGIRQRRLNNFNHYRHFRDEGRTTVEGRVEDKEIEIRRQVYKNQLYSLHVGTNRISRYKTVTPESFARDESLLRRARKWIRRELLVFEFLNPDSSSFGTTDRRASNAEFLLEYIVSILQAIDLKGSAGQAEELLKDFLGRQNTRLFLHELEAWLRSPYQSLSEWDAAIQYPER